MMCCVTGSTEGWGSRWHWVYWWFWEHWDGLDWGSCELGVSLRRVTGVTGMCCVFASGALVSLRALGWTKLGFL